MTLIDRLRAATEGSRELDAEIWKFFALDEYERTKKAAIDAGWSDYLDPILADNAPHYTTNLQDALSLVEEGCEWEMTNIYGVARVTVGLNFSDALPGPFYASREDGNVTLAFVEAAVARLEAMESDHGR